MTASWWLQSLASQPLVERLGWTLIHTLWQGTAIALILAVTLRSCRRAAPTVRYAAGCAALLVFTLCAIVTFLALSGGPAEVATPRESAVSIALTTASEFLAPSDTASSQRIQLAALVSLWSVGSVLLSLRMLGGYARMSSWRAGARSADSQLASRAATLAARLRCSGQFEVRIHSALEGPVTFGWLRPIILLPAGALSGLTTAQVEGLLAHELAHIRRADYLVNLCQTAAETLFYYHPAVWWISAAIRREREFCCDDLAIQTTGDRAAYAAALAMLEEMRPMALQPGMAASGGALLDRIARILGRAEVRTVHSRGAGILPLVGLLGLAATAGLWVAPAAMGAEQDSPAQPRSAGKAGPESPLSVAEPPVYVEQGRADEAAHARRSADEAAARARADRARRADERARAAQRDALSRADEARARADEAMRAAERVRDRDALLGRVPSRSLLRRADVDAERAAARRDDAVSAAESARAEARRVERAAASRLDPIYPSTDTRPSDTGLSPATAQDRIAARRALTQADVSRERAADTYRRALSADQFQRSAEAELYQKALRDRQIQRDRATELYQKAQRESRATRNLSADVYRRALEQSVAERDAARSLLDRAAQSERERSADRARAEYQLRESVSRPSENSARTQDLEAMIRRLEARTRELEQRLREMEERLREERRRNSVSADREQPARQPSTRERISIPRERAEPETPAQPRSVTSREQNNEQTGPQNLTTTLAVRQADLASTVTSVRNRYGSDHPLPRKLESELSARKSLAETQVRQTDKAADKPAQKR